MGKAKTVARTNTFRFHHVTIKYWVGFHTVDTYTEAFSIAMISLMSVEPKARNQMSSSLNKNETLMIGKNAVELRRSVVDYIDNECFTGTSSSPF